MEEIHAAFSAVADSLLRSKKENNDSKYGPVARKERELQGILEQQKFKDYLISKLPGGRYATIKEINDVRTLIFDSESVPKYILLEHDEKFKEAFEQTGGLAVGNRTGIAPAIDSADEVYELNEGRLPHRLLPVFEEALVLRAVERKRNLSRGTVYDWRGEIASNYGDSGNNPQVAQNLISLCSTGYFDKEDVFDNIYGEVVLEGTSSIQEFKSILARYIKENPFAVFVQAENMSGRDVYQMARGKIKDINQYAASPSIVEICGKGQETHPIIDDARDILSDNFKFSMNVRRDQKIDQKILQVVVDST